MKTHSEDRSMHEAAASKLEQIVERRLSGAKSLSLRPRRSMVRSKSLMPKPLLPLTSLKTIKEEIELGN